MFAPLTSARSALEGLARDFDAACLAPEDAVRALEELGTIGRIVDGMVARAAKRVSETAAHAARGERNAASFVARTLGVTAGQVRTTINTAEKLERLPGTDAAVRAGRLSAGQARMITEAASANPAAEQRLLEAAEQGLVPLRDACIAARARVEDPTARAARQRSLRCLRTWTDPDGMVAGRFRLTPEVGGQVKAAIESQVQRTFRSRRSGRAQEPHEAYAADAFASFVLGGDEVSRGASATVHVVVDHGALMRGGTADGETCEIPGVGPVDVAWYASFSARPS